ncbi:MAG: NAD(P)/FAD-dependent oxidoreductase [bacterium]|nr:NAD(P)/FAD-dependent oxidoreductase [bacterium]
MGKFNDYKHVFEPIQVGPITLKNRIQFSPHANNMVNAYGEPTDLFVKYFEEQARTGAGLISIYATPVNQEHGVDYESEINITTDKVCCSLCRLTEAAHMHDAKVSIELMHAGRGADPKMLKRGYALAPSDIPIPGQAQNLKVMDRDDMQEVIDNFVDCSLRAKRCNVDMILVHGAHGNLIGQFLSPSTNKRTDEYGGSMENRFRFPLELLKAIREAVGPDTAIEMRLSGDEMIEDGIHVDECVEFVKRAQEYIDMVHISSGLIVVWKASFYTMPPYYMPRGNNIAFAKAVKNCPDIHIPVAVVGGINSLEMIDEIIENGSADIGVMCRQFLADPDIIHKSRAGHPEDVRPCLRCQGCSETYGSHVRCSVNPGLGMMPPFDKVQPAPVKKKVVVVGGGVAGMTATRTLVERGHDVILMEQGESLGGVLPHICGLPFKGDLKRYSDWAIRMTENCGAEIRLNTKATAELIEAENPDALVVAVGSKPVKLDIPGIDGPNVKRVMDVDEGIEQVSGKVVICGGGVSGCECAIGLAMRGCEVAVVDMIPAEKFADGLPEITRNMCRMLLDDHGISRVGESRVTRIAENGVELLHSDGTTEFIEADYVVDAFGVIQRKADIAELADVILDTYLVGDANEIGNIKRANFKAYTTCCLI